MRRSSSTSSRCGASSAGFSGARTVAEAMVAACATITPWGFLSRLLAAGAEDSLQHFIRIVAIDHRAQELADGGNAGRIDLAERAGDAVGLQAGQFCDQCLALRRG